MPELPEVETVKKSLVPYLKGQKIENVKIFFTGIIKQPTPILFKERIRGRTIVDLERRGKYLLFFLDGGLTLVIHLRMTGQLTVCSGDVPISKHTHLIFFLASQQEWRFTDVRKLGLVYLVPTGNWACIHGLNNLGYEPLAEEFTLQVLGELLRGRKGKIKPFLLDQSKIAGIGNIYADEILCQAGLHPERTINTLRTVEVAKLYRAIKLILKEAVVCRGTSLRDYVDGRGQKGNFQERLQVYGRKGEPCYECQTPLERIVVAGRGTVFCPRCQKLIPNG
ncbi:MAG TPA: bifunctional DNA-formamidopyrimidine glycosylase/DNA-(apurinic or apyrimidinic site) lyase [Clostridia bacterium]|nr:bifunctional DNA-formamidopyrimidine glycosylase/DNA-(apurinic or apyrimidinic site) lyase [Clostridia bacterium]HHY06137.1 bifunctional DNA-formamidopyrimidine glycosylase/DNA-(apurinic or apyrimidinic site) lyase [Clostridia bacterium]